LKLTRKSIFPEESRALDKTGTGFAYSMGSQVLRLALGLVLGLCVLSCVVPEDIRERPSDGDGETETPYDYWPVIVPVRPAVGRTIVPAQCDSFTFHFELTRLPDATDTERIQGLEVHWFWDGGSNPVSIGRIREGLLVGNRYDINPKTLYDEHKPDAVHLLEVIVSDLGFEPTVISPDNRTPISGAHVAWAYWFIVLDPDILAEGCAQR